MTGGDPHFAELFEDVQTRAALLGATQTTQQQLGTAPRRLEFTTLMQERSDSDRLLQKDFDLSYSVFHSRCYQRLPTIVAIAERANIATHPSFVAAAARVLANEKP